MTEESIIDALDLGHLGPENGSANFLIGRMQVNHKETIKACFGTSCHTYQPFTGNHDLQYRTNHSTENHKSHELEIGGFDCSLVVSQ
jgi:hypothetical protein